MKFSLTGEEDMREQMQCLARELISELDEIAPGHSQELLSVFVSELFLSATEQSIKRDRLKKQAEGIAKAKAKGVHFGPRAKPLPDNFEEARRSWRNREMNLRDAARLCGMPATTFYDAVRRAEHDR